MRWSLVFVLMLMSALAWAQESMMRAEFRREGERVKDACKDFGFKTVPGCAYEIFTDHPLHIAAGSLPAQNGFGLGAAFVADKNTNNWRLTWDVDAVGSTNGSWRAGGHMKLIHTPNEAVKVVMPVVSQPGESAESRKPAKKDPINLVHPYTVFNLYAQSISLNKLNYFGEGNDTTFAGASVFGMTQTIVGANAIKPVYEWAVIRSLKLALVGEVNGRFVDVRGNNAQSSPSIETVYTNASAPGLSSQPGFVQLGEGFRIDPVLFKDHFELNYLGNFQQFFAPSSSTNSFLRWTADLNHTFYLYGYSKAKAKNTDAIGPDECAPNGGTCPKIAKTANLNGFVGVRLLVSESINSTTSAVPFYFQQTLGGSDIDGNMALGSYQDYRFRGPNLLLLQQSFEHSVWGPFGLKFMTDEGRVATTRGDLGFDHLRHSFAAGLTLRAGAFPMVSLMFAWGGAEGHHNIFNMNNSLLGGSARPLLD
ncbi:MAG TPA: hypothetical protein VNY51_14035 [Candidatus Dormibacteraeota bacterium]|jgi:hypothetical protein|nr:hypothetical protein [Candidatus Dormibacteraeota bacterium]